ncbi:PLP-dependent cysteine synthase family protein [Geothrix alkalitolerans]|uniref:PLP-dependent cysteine synthase family protein n=1 Tax=Geothrix alkalitolerans TaxID=2922724 RepID=UPI001FAEC838|nr:cysteine synthase family protein [Geothrix alkalitolerans]
MQYRKPCGSVLEAIGNTPLVRLRRVVSDLPAEVFAKLEFLNPMGSSKDRIAKHMIEAAERDGRLKPGDTIIENSSGNTAMGLALMAIQKGYKLKVVVRDTISQEKLNQLLALGAQVHKVDTSLPPEHPDSYNNITPRLARETPNCFFPDQHGNRENNAAHYAGTGPEIWEQMEGRIDVLVAGAGTGGTIGGVGRYLKEKDPKIKVVAVDPVGSVFTPHFRGEKELKAGPYKIEGLGDEFLIPTMEFELIDEMFQVTDRDAFHHARRLVKEEGVLGGGSSGAALWAVRQVAAKLPPMDHPARIVTVFPDGAGRYLSSIFNDAWLAERGLLEAEG